MTPAPLIDTPAALAAALARWRARPWLALDTEFVRETTYYPLLCLIQVGDGDTSECIDALALGAQLGTLWEVLAQHGILKVFHAASQDLEIFVQHGGACPAPMFDTQLAAALLGDGDQLGYAALIEKRLGLKLDKSLTRTDWAKRPLSAAELAYAADDVRHLATIYPTLREELAARGRLAWLEEDAARLVDPARYVTKPQDAWRRLKGLARLEASARGTAAALAAWRETQAQARDRPRKWILEDDALYRIAERRPVDIATLGKLGVLPPKTLERHGRALLEVIAAAAHDAAPDIAAALPLEGADKTRFQRLQNLVRERANVLNLPASLLANRAELETLARRGADAGVLSLQGWRRT